MIYIRRGHCPKNLTGTPHEATVITVCDSLPALLAFCVGLNLTVAGVASLIRFGVRATLDRMTQPLIATLIVAVVLVCFNLYATPVPAKARGWISVIVVALLVAWLFGWLPWPPHPIATPR